MNKQLTFSLISDELAKAKTSKKEFLEKIERIIPFDEWIEISHDHRFKRWFDISPIRAIKHARLKGGHRKPITGHL